MWGSLIGVMENQDCLFGVVHQPFLKETFYGDASGAFMKTPRGTRPLSTSKTTDPARAILYCTHPAMFSGESDKAAFARVDSACRFSRFGSDCYGYCLLAAGFADLVVENGLNSYDIVPHIPIIEAAGGVVTDWEGKPAHGGGKVIAAANAALHEATLKLLNA
jgi:fructose-1,6-bisphosphatase/inositol monophosphatase family enzyme